MRTVAFIGLILLKYLTNLESFEENENALVVSNEKRYFFVLFLALFVTYQTFSFHSN